MQQHASGMGMQQQQIEQDANTVNMRKNVKAAVPRKNYTS